MMVRVLLVLLVTAGWAFAFRPRVPDPTEPERAPSIDAQLLEELRADSLKPEIDRQLFAPGLRPPGGEGSPAGRRGPSLQRGAGFEGELIRELGPAGVPEDQEPLFGIARQMREVEGLISRSDSGPQTQDLEDRIVRDLEELIKRARRCCRQCKAAAGSASRRVAPRRATPQPGQKKPGGRKAGSKAVRNPNAAPGTSEPRRPDMDEMIGVLKDLWGELPERARQQMLELPVEEFLPKYELLIEEYFRRLAEEKRGMSGE